MLLLIFIFINKGLCIGEFVFFIVFIMSYFVGNGVVDLLFIRWLEFGVGVGFCF